MLRLIAVNMKFMLPNSDLRYLKFSRFLIIPTLLESLQIKKGSALLGPCLQFEMILYFFIVENLNYKSIFSHRHGCAGANISMIITSSSLKKVVLFCQ